VAKRRRGARRLRAVIGRALARRRPRGWSPGAGG
jgi:hypothetical protein